MRQVARSAPILDAMHILFAFVSPKMISKIFIIFALREKHEKKESGVGRGGIPTHPDSELWSVKFNSADHFYCAPADGYILQTPAGTGRLVSWYPILSR
jgi:hypothetical protein